MRDMISVASGFQYSVNINYDLGNDEKLNSFIPTKSALSLLEDILLSVYPISSDRARVLIGAYGKGKSHIVLTILSILMKRDLSLFGKLIPKVQENKRLYQLIQNYYESDDKILPVVISGSNTSLTQAFLLSLQRTLSEHGLLDAMPETNYEAAIGVIKRWEKDFPETFEKFKQGINIPVEIFIDQLSNYDIVAYESFEWIYPTLTAGSVFNPFLGFDVVELYESVAKSLNSRGYSGIYVVYDEFSKYLEANIIDASVSDTKMLQDFAEKCCRSGVLQLHLMLISHKEIANYIDRLPKEKTDGWRGVSERFKHVHMNNNFSQTYEIISSVIKHKGTKWKSFCEKYDRDFEALFTRYKKHQMFTDAQGEIEVAIKGCFPLHPVSTFILPRLSERIAQNERTLFTFLSAEGTATLPAFLDDYNNDFTLVTPDLIYDYFEPLFKKEVYAGDIHDTYILTSKILNQLPENDLGCKIIKTISLIYILEQFERLNPTKEQIIGIYSGSYEVSEIEQAISDLIEKEFVVYIKRSNDYLRLKQTSGVDVRQKIHDQVELLSGKTTVKDILNSSNFDNYMYPSRYNDDHEMTRFFTFQFISGSEVTEDVDWNIKSEAIEGDGIIYGIIPENEQQLKKLIDIINNTSKNYERYLFVLPRSYQDIDSVAYEYIAVTKLRDNTIDDPVLFDEYEVVFEDLQEIIKGFISSYTHPESYLSVYYHNGRALEIHRKAGLTEVMSQICDNIYGLTPIINNESVNKNEITSVAQNSRNKIVSALLRTELEPNLGLSGSGQEISILRSTLLRTGIWNDDGGVPQINLHPKDSAVRNMMETIEDFILEVRQNGRKSFAALYERLTSPKYHIGLRYGIIPIYLAAVLHNYRQQTVINDRFGPVQTSADILIQINSNPSNYSLEYLDWNPEKEYYITRLADAFKEYIVDAEKASNSYDYVANAMRRWYMALPKYSKESTKRPSGEKLVRRQIDVMRLLRQNTSSSDLLFKKLPEAVDYRGDYNDAATDIIATKEVFDGLMTELKKDLIQKTRIAFLPSQDESKSIRITLAGAVAEWCDHLDPKSFEQLFPDGTERFLQHLRTMTNDEDLFITRLAKLATGLRLEDWNEKTIEQYHGALARYITTAKDFHSSVVAETINDTSSYQVTFADESGESTTRRFEKVDVSPRGKLLFNQILASLEAMGHSISEQEKRQILMEVLKKLC
ncbi:MAG: restriction endonuclease subunit S [Firmicutes bacterium]|nr:restriction endonuclease subunit S [Bacillota bacterium]